MGYHCDFCGEQKSIVYCRSDAASLCLSCDRNVHSANALSRRHSRTLVCERCNSQPSFVRCMEERISLCQNCDWMGHTGLNTGPAHKRQPVNCYSGCPSAAELSEIWSFLLDFPSVGDSTCEQRMGSMCITDNRPSDCQGSLGKNNVQNASLLMDKSTVWTESATPLLDPNLHNVDQLAGSSCSTTPKVFLSEAKWPALCEDDGLYNDFDMDEIDLSIENYEEFFGVTHNNPEQLFDDGLFGTKDLSGSNCLGDYAGEGSWGGRVNMPACSNVASADSVMSCIDIPSVGLLNRCEFLHRAADLTIVPSAAIGKDLEAAKVTAANRIRLWNKGVDSESFNPRFHSHEMRERLSDGEPDRPLIVHVGRLGFEKSLDFLKRVMEKLPDARIAFIGDGPYREELEKMFSGMPAVFTGMLQGEELSQAYACGDIFVMPSESETLGQVVMEAMSSGLPVVAARAGGIRDIISEDQQGKTGYLFNPGDLDDCLSKVEPLLHDQELRETIGKAARAEMEKYDWRAATRKIRNEQYNAAIWFWRKKRAEFLKPFFWLFRCIFHVQEPAIEM